MKFLNRERELESLNQAYGTPNANFLILYGRRRVGKTRLIREFIGGKPHIYFLCDRELEIGLLRRMQRAIGFSLRDPLLEGIEFKEWETLFRDWLDHADIGSGGGLDCFYAAKEVGLSGRVIGLDMTQEMIERAIENARRLGFANVEFRLGDAETMPVDDASVDVVISNLALEEHSCNHCYPHANYKPDDSPLPFSKLSKLPL